MIACCKPRLVLIAVCLCATIDVAAEQTFYAQPQLFTTAPDPSKSTNVIARFGPVGMGIDLVHPAFTMMIHSIEEGSPAAATGKLKKGQFIQTINGRKLADIDPRIQLGQILAEAEATDGILKLMVSDQPHVKAEEVVVTIPVLGAYSETWPLNCPKSDNIVRGFAEYLSRPNANQGFCDIGMLFLLATGEERDLEPVRTWAHAANKRTPTYAWHLGYGGLALCEYYLRTGDDAVLPTIQNWVNSAVAGQYLNGWAGRGGVASVTYGGGGGHLNAGGTLVTAFLLLAKECGADVPDHALHGALRQFYRWAGRGNNPYGNNKPEIGFVDNGKNGKLAFVMAAAAALTPNGEQSVYAAARDAAALTSFYTTSYMLHGHTGGGIGEIWRSAAMGLLREKRPHHYRQFMDNRQWHYDMSRRWDGSFGILGGARYDTLEWGAGYALTYVVPRKTLRLTGAPPTQFSKLYQLPDRPWGTSADDDFASIEPAALSDGSRPDFSHELMAEHSGRPLLNMFSTPDVSDQTLRTYAHHPDAMIRLMAARKAMGVNTTYLGGAQPAGEPRPGLVKELLHSQDARVRQAAVEAIAVRLEGDALVEFLGDDGVAHVVAMIDNPQESWWVKNAALLLVGRLPQNLIVPQVDRILPYLRHEEWWLQNAALIALAPVVADERCYRSVLPAMGEMLRHSQVYNATAPLRRGTLPDNLRHAGPLVQRLAAETLKEAYVGFAGTTTAPGGQNITSTYDAQLGMLASSLTGLEGGYDMLYAIAKERFPNNPLPYAEIFLKADPEKLSPELRDAVLSITRNELIDQFVEQNRRKLDAVIENKHQSGYVVSELDELLKLYRRIGIEDYAWRPFGPDLFNETWDYFSFDPPEQQKYEVSPWRYRNVTYPAGIENWYMPDFDPTAAGWGRGLPAFGQRNGTMESDPTLCDFPGCRHGDPIRTLWEKEVLLVRGTFEFPPLDPEHRYRIRVGTGQHIGSGDGYRIYINGKQLIEVKQGVNRREGAQPRGAFITTEFVEEFNKGPVTIAATTFLRYGSRAIVTMPPVPQGIFSLWVEEIELPPALNSPQDVEVGP
jgi:hypothetical protein